MSEVKEIQKENKLGTMPMFKLMLTVSIPMVISMIVQALYNVVDTLFVAQLSAEQYELTAISLAFAAQNFMIAVATGTGVGINALLSKSLGEKNYERANKVANNGLFLAICSYIVFLVAGLTLVEPYMRLMTNDPTVIQRGKEYLSICFIFSFGLFGEIAMERLMISTGKTHLAMITQGIGAIFNIAFDPIFIFVFDLGIRGAAIATVLGQIFAFGVAIILNRRFNKDIHITFRKFKPDGRIIGRIYAIGIPSIVMASIGSVMNMMLNGILNSFERLGEDLGRFAQNAFGAYFKLQSFVFMPVFGLNNGIVPIVAYNYGAKNKKRMMSAAFIGIALAMGYTLACLAVFEIFPKQLLMMFIPDATRTMEIAIVTVRVIAISYIFAGPAIIMGSIYQALGKSIFSMIISITRQLVVLIPLAYLLSLSNNIDLVWWCFPISEAVSLAISVVFFIITYKKIISKVDLPS